MPALKDVGEPERGFLVASKETSSGTITLPDGSTRELVSTWETQVTELSTEAIDTALFEIPSGFRLVERIRQEPVPPPGDSPEASLRAAGAPLLAGLSRQVDIPISAKITIDLRPGSR